MKRRSLPMNTRDCSFCFRDGKKAGDEGISILNFKDQAICQPCIKAAAEGDSSPTTTTEEINCHHCRTPLKSTDRRFVGGHLDSLVALCGTCIDQINSLSDFSSMVAEAHELGVSPAGLAAAKKITAISAFDFLGLHFEGRPLTSITIGDVIKRFHELVNEEVDKLPHCVMPNP